MESERGCLLSQGAESKIFDSIIFGKQCVEKYRLTKRYRVAELDQKLIKHRILQECRCMAKCIKAGLSVAAVYFVDIPNGSIFMEKIIGCTVKDFFETRAISGTLFR